eukprot:TRINITY_DN35088_c0_g1_i1.p1 TRINITY_DN35088_c0_g1~~TRINITY_DN35088_c0_g1_i1.p1  ORF type:complete len:408 (-),score=55.28 TRINITY_DN35088_c0_g1_i1:607-1830(-)
MVAGSPLANGAVQDAFRLMATVESQLREMIEEERWARKQSEVRLEIRLAELERRVCQQAEAQDLVPSVTLTSRASEVGDRATERSYHYNQSSALTSPRRALAGESWQSSALPAQNVLTDRLSSQQAGAGGGRLSGAASTPRRSEAPGVDLHDAKRFLQELEQRRQVEEKAAAALGFENLIPVAEDSCGFRQPSAPQVSVLGIGEPRGGQPREPPAAPAASPDRTLSPRGGSMMHAAMAVAAANREQEQFERQRAAVSPPKERPTSGYSLPDSHRTPSDYYSTRHASPPATSRGGQLKIPINLERGDVKKAHDESSRRSAPWPQSAREHHAREPFTWRTSLQSQAPLDSSRFEARVIGDRDSVRSADMGAGGYGSEATRIAEGNAAPRQVPLTAASLRTFEQFQRSRS